MKDAAKKDIVHSIETAKKAIAEARTDLAGVISEVEASQRAQKRHVGEPLKGALDRLRIAMDELATLEKLITR